MSNSNVRQLALELLLKINKEQAYSNLLLNQTINKHDLNDKDIGLLTELVYGTVQRQLTLEYYLNPFLPKRIKAKDRWVLTLLHMSIYQMVYLDRIPARAVLFEAVEIAKKKGHSGLASMVNGILRNFQRKDVQDFSEISSPSERIAVEYSHPIWLVNRWIAQYGEEAAQKICEANLKIPAVSARVNTYRTTREEVIESLADEGVAVKPGKLSSDAIEVVNGNIPKTKTFKEGYVTIQDESSMLVARALHPQQDERILDCCAAPGGKTTHIAELLRNTGEVTALDLHAHKIKLINQAVGRLKLNNVKTMTLDSRKAKESFNKESFDKILVDAPCTGFGVIHRKPDIKWSKQEEDIAAIQSVQLEILEAASSLLKPGGMLVYSTCTIEKEENEEVIKQFVQSHPEFTFDSMLTERLPAQLLPYINKQNGYVQILPHYFNSDGFFIACIKKQTT
ncbi:16S rRNA (cytosine(967)-C(5))-methyltransferase RsmB [Bacillus taeanensis]|uniref:16S rRNA (cytosine(967)-C(5))-methyltransferase n=1 Tax=Bacillus taeanensis TaxID=273032 RepID=A0A366XNM2_9BACI|nr:16S rRNA (cytosine(967)-C(5))-methyltransferase RsmB [Bacillus taeanensis]RBW67507.1 16S rRNA (cytosine(967)-C(5))-methyltransferase [Bacillus taeanensis]